MAQYTTTVKGSIAELRRFIEHNKSQLGFTISTEDETEGTVEGIKYYVAGYERYAYIGGNRVSLNVTMMEFSEGVRVVAISLGGSQGAFVKINHWSEDNFLNAFVSIVEDYRKKKGEV